MGYVLKWLLEVKVSVWVENVLIGSCRLINCVFFWYVLIVMGLDVWIIFEVFLLEYFSKDEEEKGKEWYEL